MTSFKSDKKDDSNDQKDDTNDQTDDSNDQKDDSNDAKIDDSTTANDTITKDDKKQNDNNETEQEYPVYDNQCVISGECYETTDDLKLHKYAVHDEKKPPIKNESQLSHFLVNNELESEESHEFQEGTNLENLETENDSFETGYEEDAYDDEKVPNMNNQFGNQYLCDQCDAKFYKKHELDSHKSLVHIENKPHMCPICGLSFGSNHRLRMHNESVHEKKKPYKCSSCGYRSSLKGSMTKHIAKVHEGANIKIMYLGDNPYKCVNCDFSTAVKSNLTKHIDEVHDGNWCCELCDSAFTNRSNLNSHVRQVHEGKKRKKKVHEENKPFKCEICDYSCGVKSSLKKHMAHVHKKSNRPKINKAPIMPFLFGGINHVKPIELTKIEKD